MFITPQMPAPHIGAPQFGVLKKKKPQEPPPAATTPKAGSAENSKNTKPKKVAISKLVEKQLQRLAEKFNKDMDLMKSYYQIYASLTDENGLRTVSDSEAIKLLEQELTNPVRRHTLALHENGRRFPR